MLQIFAALFNHANTLKFRRYVAQNVLQTLGVPCYPVVNTAATGRTQTLLTLSAAINEMLCNFKRLRHV
ncbi:hypothetical protein BBBOND_0402010 [Babesia bigemina]|uniref:Uncharacterized protein n=1 Tax=Babesia bigemina TaxID=5866 RepID=A0A061DDU9_BABBI|nr:hypothetical protein BBBOND_0402010 [Babesia bigemina]CDR97709.1 hypothetical protein BBBOND_0402010 [Babesia bigemina]|eukprot:XP_012769895.1 hypothetical protein BBBOND_0402010 [Babesia bigemina]